MGPPCTPGGVTAPHEWGLKGCREGTWTSWPLEPQRPRLVLLPPAWAGGLGSGLPAPAPWRGSVCPRGSRQAGTWCLRALALTQPRQPHLQKGSKARRTLGTGGPPCGPVLPTHGRSRLWKQVVRLTPAGSTAVRTDTSLPVWRSALASGGRPGGWEEPRVHGLPGEACLPARPQALFPPGPSALTTQGSRVWRPLVTRGCPPALTRRYPDVPPELRHLGPEGRVAGRRRGRRGV